MNKLVVEYDPNNRNTISDGESKAFVEQAINNKPLVPHIVISNGLLITLFRVAIVEKKIKYTELEFLFEGKAIKVNKYGKCSGWPKGFGDMEEEALDVILGWAP